MADVNLVKSIYTGSDVTSLGEVAAADTPSVPALKDTGLTASLPVFTNADKVLESKSIADTMTALSLSGTNTGDETALRIGAIVAAATEKNPPIDADIVGFADTEATNTIKKATWTQVKAFLKTYFDTLYNKYVHPNHSGDVTSVADGATTIAAKAVTLAKMNDMATASLIYRKTAGAGAPEVNTLATLKTDLGLTGTNTGDEVAATTSVAGKVELATNVESIAGTSTSLVNTPSGNAASEAIIKNPLAMAQGVNMTYAASGSTGIVVADNDNIDFGTGNFTLVWKGSLPDWTPSDAAGLQILMQKWQATADRWMFYINRATYGYKLEYDHYKSGGTSVTAITTTAPTGLIDGCAAHIVAVITRETAIANGSVSFYVNGLLFETVSIPAGTPADISNSGILYIVGSNSTRYQSISHSAITYNRALSAAEVLSLYRNGIDFADKWGSQTSIITGTDSTFAGASNWANVDINAYDETTGGVLTITASAAAQYCTLPVANATTVANKKYRLNFDVTTLTSTWTIKDFTGTQTIGTISATGTAQKIEFTASTTGGLRLVAVANDSAAVLDNFLLYEIGATLALEPEGIQPAPGQWLDSSTNKLHAMQPAAGSSQTRRIKTFEVRWTNTWSASHEAQYIGGVNQAVLPVGCYITDIIGVISGATIEDIIIGDGSDTDRWVAITSGLAAGTVAFTLANRISDGTNYKLVVDPDANFTGSIAFTIKGIILQ